MNKHKKYEYISLDKNSLELHEKVKNILIELEKHLNTLSDSDNKRIMISKLDEFYMWFLQSCLQHQFQLKLEEFKDESEKEIII